MYKFGKGEMREIKNIEYGTIKIMYVPYKYKDEAKSDGVKFDYENKIWYIFLTNPNYEKLCKKWNKNNFRKKDYGRSEIMINE